MVTRQDRGKEKPRKKRSESVTTALPRLSNSQQAQYRADSPLGGVVDGDARFHATPVSGEDGTQKFGDDFEQARRGPRRETHAGEFLVAAEQQSDDLFAARSLNCVFHEIGERQTQVGVRRNPRADAVEKYRYFPSRECDPQHR
nr:hypothetical protein [Mycolicibacterium chubuense]